MHKSVTTNDNARWRGIVAQLEELRPDMADEFVARLESIEGYDPVAGLVEPQDKYGVCLEALRLILQSMESGRTEDTLRRFGTYVGSKRARQGVDAESVTSAVRMVFSVIWSRVLEICGPQDAALLVGRVDMLWRIIDDYARESHSSYLFESVRVAKEESEMLQRTVSALFTGRVTTSEALKRTAQALRVDAEQRLSLAAAGPGERAALEDFARGAAESTRVYSHVDGDATFVLWVPLSDLRAEAAGELPPPRTGYVRDVAGLAAVRFAALMASTLSDLARARDQVPLTVDTHWARLARIGLEDRGVDLTDDIDEALAECSASERDRLIETIGTFLENGSVAETASTMYCHRNTILNRIRRFEELTGLNPALPAHAARIVVAWN